MTPLVHISAGRACDCGPLFRTSGTRPPSPFGNPQSPSALRFGRPSLVSCGLAGSAQRPRHWQRCHTLSCCELSVTIRCLGPIITNLAVRFSVPRARPVYYVSYMRKGVAWAPYVKQRLDTCGVLGRLEAVRAGLQTLRSTGSP
jgi:hypothetical protein